jgi:anti-sigma B factor antagonist
MADKETLFISKIYEENPTIGIIELGKFVLGGNEALDFVAQLETFSKQDVKHIIIDLKNVELMNSSGLGMLVSGLRNLKKHDALLKLISIPPKVENLLKMTHLDEVFDSYTDLKAALKNCQ